MMLMAIHFWHGGRMILSPFLFFTGWLIVYSHHEAHSSWERFSSLQKIMALVNAFRCTICFGVDFFTMRGVAWICCPQVSWRNTTPPILPEMFSITPDSFAIAICRYYHNDTTLTSKPIPRRGCFGNRRWYYWLFQLFFGLSQNLHLPLITDMALHFGQSLPFLAFGASGTSVAFFGFLGIFSTFLFGVRSRYSTRPGPGFSPANLSNVLIVGSIVGLFTGLRMKTGL